MKLRQQRIHTQGESNKDYRRIPMGRPEDKTQTEFLATAKKRNFNEVVQSRLDRVAPNPVLETQKEYAENERDIKEKTLIQYPRYAQLEEKELYKKVFNGESNTIFDPSIKMHIRRQQTSHVDKRQSVVNLAKYKHDDYSKQIQETQLVNIQNNVESLEGEVDLKKVQEIRRALRRRYANRKNYQKIFNAWDRETRGKITVANALDMIKKLGIKANMNEARVLVASVDQDLNGSMGLDEFMDLIFNDSDNLNVDLHNIPKLKIDNEQEQEEHGDMISNQATHYREVKHQNQITVILKNKVKSLANMFRLGDEVNSGYVSQEKLNDILHRQNIPESIMSIMDRKWIFSQFNQESYKFNYKNFINYLNDFQFKPDEIYKDPKETQKNKTQLQKTIGKFQESEDQRIYVFDAQKVNPWHLEKIRQDYRKVKRIMLRYIQNKEDFTALFMQSQKIQDKSEIQNMDISKAELTKFVQNMFLNLGEKDVKKLEVENFLSAFKYNKHEKTPARDLEYVIFEEKDGEWYEKFSRDTHHPVPPVNVKFHPEFPPEELEKDKLNNTDDNIQQIDENSNEGFKINEDSARQLESIQKQLKNSSSLKQLQPPLDNRRTQTAQSSMRRKNYLPNCDHRVKKSGNLQEILQKLENRVFCGSQNSYKIFQKFDVDKDGYISHNDLVQQLKTLALFDHQEMKQLLNYVDPQSVGHVSFRQFSDKIRNGVQITDNLGLQCQIPGIIPSKEYFDSTKHINTQINKKQNQLRQEFEPKQYQLRPMSRYQNTPCQKNTFQNFRAQLQSPGYMSDAQRFNRNHNHRTEWQKAEIHKKYGYEEGRVKTKTNNLIQQNIHNLNVQNQFDAKKEAICKSKGILQWTYEHRAHLQNNYHGGGKNLVDEVRDQRIQDNIQPPLYGKWQKN